MKIEDENIVLIVMDTVSAFNIPLYGHDRNTAPFLTKFAKENTYAKFGYSNAPWTAPSHASLFSGKLTSEHGTSTHNYSFDDDSFVEDLQNKGYLTQGFSENPLISETIGFDKGFDKLIGGRDNIVFENQGVSDLMDIVDESLEEKGEMNTSDKYFRVMKNSLKKFDVKSVLNGAKYISKKKLSRGFNAADQINQQVKKTMPEDQKFFYFLNYNQAHAPYEPPEETLGTWCEENPEKMKEYSNKFHFEEKTFWWKEWPEEKQESIRALYDEEILYLDSKIEELVKQVQEEDEDTVFIIVSDHGENINHYGMRGHNCGIWQRLIRVPIIVGGKPIPNHVIDQNVSLRQLGEFIKGEKELEELGSEEVEAQYKGARGILEHHKKSLEKFSEENMKFINNRSNCLIKGEKGLIKNTKIDDIGFLAEEKTFSEENKFEEVKDIKGEVNRPFDLYEK